MKQEDEVRRGNELSLIIAASVSLIGCILALVAVIKGAYVFVLAFAFIGIIFALVTVSSIYTNKYYKAGA